MIATCFFDRQHWDSACW